MLARCSWCGAGLNGQVIGLGKVGHATFGRGDKPEIVYYQIGFCSDGCYWRWEIEEHGFFGITSDEARQHLIKVHGLVHPPGEPAGRQSRECFDFFAREAENVMWVKVGSGILN